MTDATPLHATFSRRGRWFLPGGTDRPVAGTLDFSPQAGASLKLLGSLQEDLSKLDESFNPPVVLGMDERGAPITLYRCMQTNTQLGFGAGGTQVSVELLAEYVLLGIHVPDEKQFTFDRALVRFWGLELWAARTGFDIRLKRNKGAVIRYSPPKRVILAKTSNIAVTLETGHRGPTLAMVQVDAEIAQRSVLRLQFAKRKTIPDILESVRIAANFLSLGIGAAVYPLEVTLQSPKIQMELSEGNKHRMSIPLLYGLAALSDLGEPPLPVFMNFSLAAVSDRIETVMTKWIASSATLEPVWNLFFGALYAPRMYLPFKFLSLAYALESFHRRCRAQLVDPEHDKRLRGILDSAPTESRGWLSEKLKFSHEPTFRARLKILLEEFGELGEVFASPREVFVSRVVDARNHLTHYEGDEQILSNVEALYRLTQRLQGLVAVCLLSETGFTHKEIQMMVRGRSQFFQRILFSISEEQ